MTAASAGSDRSSSEQRPTGSADATFDHDAAERVLRRAIELADGDPSAPDAAGISEQALHEAAEELGIDEAAVRRAVSEERAGVLTPDLRRGDRLVGPAYVTASRVIDGTSSSALEQVDRWLRRNGALRRQRFDDHDYSAEYARRSDPAAGLQRTVRSVSGQEHLGRVRRLRVVTYQVDAGRSMVALTADLGLERTATVAGATSIAGVGATVSVVEALAWTPWLWLGVPASIAAGTGVLVARAHTVPDIESALHGVLDRVAAGDQPTSVFDDMRHRLFGGLGRSRRSA